MFKVNNEDNKTMPDVFIVTFELVFLLLTLNMCSKFQHVLKKLSTCVHFEHCRLGECREQFCLESSIIERLLQ